MTKSFARTVLVSLALAASAFLPTGLAHADSVTFALSNLTFRTATLNGNPQVLNISDPAGVDGHMVWTYPTGNFSGGSGVLTDIILPITTYPLSSAQTTASLGDL